MEDIDNYSVEIDESYIDNDYDDVDVTETNEQQEDTNIEFE